MRARLAVTAAVLVSALAVPAVAGAHGFSASGSVFEGLRGPGFPEASTYDTTKNMHPMGFSERTGTTNSDLAFWGDRVYQGNYVGFRILDVSSPAQPRQLLDYRDCAGNQGDVIIWDDILVRSWNSGAPAGATCDGDPVPQGFEGLHVFDVSNPADPDLVAEIEAGCSSTTARRARHAPASTSSKCRSATPRGRATCASSRPDGAATTRASSSVTR
jgi:hypothetical protein